MNREREKMRFMQAIPVPREVSKVGGLKGNVKNVVRIEFGCYLCNNEGVTIESKKVEMWGRLALAGAQGVVAIAELNPFGIVEQFANLMDSVKEIFKNTNKEELKKYEALLRRSEGGEGGGEGAEALPYIDIEEEKYIRGKLTEKKWLDNYEIYKDEDGDGDGKGEGDKCSFVWRCKVNCQAKRKVKAQEGLGKLGASEDI